MTQNPHTVLVVEDNPEVSTVVMLCLRGVGFRVFQAGDGEAGFQLVLKEHPDLILLDEYMPGMSGHALLALVKGNSTTAHIPVIMIAGSGMQDEIEWRNRGAFALLAKPFQFHELLAIVRKALSLPSFA